MKKKEKKNKENAKLNENTLLSTKLRQLYSLIKKRSYEMKN